jgi:hypothetical protein
MSSQKFEITEPVYGLNPGDVLTVTARYGHWHPYDLKLETDDYRSKELVVTEKSVGFSEANILDPTARFGDWHEYALDFDPSERSADQPTSGPAAISNEDFESVTVPRPV